MLCLFNLSKNNYVKSTPSKWILSSKSRWKMGFWSKFEWQISWMVFNQHIKTKLKSIFSWISLNKKSNEKCQNVCISVNCDRIRNTNYGNWNYFERFVVRVSPLKHFMNMNHCRVRIYCFAGCFGVPLDKYDGSGPKVLPSNGKKPLWKNHYKQIQVSKCVVTPVTNNS